MRGALVILVAAGLALGGTLVSASGADRPRLARAEASVTGGDAGAQGAVAVSGNGEERVRTDVDDPGVRVGRGEAIARADGGPAGYATAAAEELELLDGRIVANGVRRTAELGPRGVERRGGVYALRVDGNFYGDIQGARKIAFNGGRLILNRGSTGLRLVLDEGREIRISVARVRTVAAPRPTPTPTATPRPTATPTPKATPGPKKRKKRKKPSYRKRLDRLSFTFPLAGKARVSDTFGAARAKPVVTHKGTDIFAPFGTPVVAVSDGVLSRVGTLQISGNRLWLTTKEGDAFFYAHLSTFSPAARNADEVTAGTVLGYVGNTGDAEPTPPHVHFEIHPGGERKPAVDPYPVVKEWQERQDAPASAGRPGALIAVRDFIAE